MPCNFLGCRSDLLRDFIASLYKSFRCQHVTLPSVEQTQQNQVELVVK